MDKNNTINELTNNVEQLLEVATKLKQENRKLRVLLDIERTANENNKLKICELGNTLTAVTIAKSINEIANTPRQAHTKINNLIKQIDRCIALLNK